MGQRSLRKTAHRGARSQTRLKLVSKSMRGRVEGISSLCIGGRLKFIPVKEVGKPSTSRFIHDQIQETHMLEDDNPRTLVEDQLVITATSAHIIIRLTNKIIFV